MKYHLHRLAIGAACLPIGIGLVYFWQVVVVLLCALSLWFVGDILLALWKDRNNPGYEELI